MRFSLQPRSRRATRTSTRQPCRIRDEKSYAATVEIIALFFLPRKVSSTRYLQPLPGACCSCMLWLCLRRDHFFSPPLPFPLSLLFFFFYFASQTGPSQQMYLKVACSQLCCNGGKVVFHTFTCFIFKRNEQAY